MVMLAVTHADKPIVVTRCLSGLARSQAPQLRTMCRTLINAPFNPDAEDVVAYAATLLAPLPDPERVDMLLLAKAVDHRSTAIRNTSRLAIEQLPKQRAQALLALAKAEPEKPPISLLKRYLSGIDWRAALIPPTRPKEVTAESAASALTSGTNVAKKVPTVTPPAHSTRGQIKLSDGSRPQHTDIQSAMPASGGSDAASAASLGVPLAKGTRDTTTLQSHRLPEFALASDSLLTNEIVMSKDYRRIAAALAECTIRHGTTVALQFNNRLFYALTDPNNTERGRFEDIARCWFPEDTNQSS